MYPMRYEFGKSVFCDFDGSGVTCSCLGLTARGLFYLYKICTVEFPQIKILATCLHIHACHIYWTHLHTPILSVQHKLINYIHS